MAQRFLKATALIAAVALFAGAAPAQDTANDRAYTLTLMCAVLSQGSADTAHSMDALRKMQRAMGYSNARLADDMSKMATTLGSQQRADPTSATRNRALCRRLGLIS